MSEEHVLAETMLDAAASGNLDLMKQIHQTKPESRFVDLVHTHFGYPGLTAMSVAAESGLVEILHWLYGSGCREHISRPNMDGVRPMHSASNGYWTTALLVM